MIAITYPFACGISKAKHSTFILHVPHAINLGKGDFIGTFGKQIPGLILIIFQFVGIEWIQLAIRLFLINLLRHGNNNLVVFQSTLQPSVGRQSIIGILDINGAVVIVEHQLAHTCGYFDFKNITPECIIGETFLDIGLCPACRSF